MTSLVHTTRDTRLVFLIFVEVEDEKDTQRDVANAIEAMYKKSIFSCIYMYHKKSIDNSR